MRLWTRLLAISALLLTAACAPFVTIDYFRPAAPEGEIARAHCPPVNSFILFKTEGVVVGAGHLRQSEGRISVLLTFEIPEGKSVALPQRTVELSTPSGDVHTGSLSGQLWAPGPAVDHPPGLPMTGKTTKRFLDQVTVYGTTEHAYYYFKATFPVQKEDSFQLKLPPFTVDGVEVELPAIRFVRDSEFFWILSLNC